MSNSFVPRPSFCQARKQHDITLEELRAEINVSLPWIDILHFDQTGIGSFEVIHMSLSALSRLSGKPYSIRDVGPLCFTTPVPREYDCLEEGRY